MARKTLTIAAVIGVAAGGAALIAGPLTPPSGPVGSTYKTLAEVQPRIPVQSLHGDAQSQFIIDQPGSYYLTSNITGASGQTGIRVLADNVSIDLCGFVVDGAGVSAAGIAVLGPVVGLSVHNGTVANWAYDGIYASTASECVFDSVRVVSCQSVGIDSGNSAVVRNCTVSGGQAGIWTRTGTRVVDCTVSSATQAGIVLLDGSLATHCVVVNSAVGIFANDYNNAILDCVVRGGTSGTKGVYLISGANRVERCKIGQVDIGVHSTSQTNTITQNTINANTGGVGTGVLLSGTGNRVDGNHIYGFARGIDVAGTSHVVLGNTMQGCTTPINGSTAMVAPVVTTAAALASNPAANISQP